MLPIVKFGLTKAGIISTLHTSVRYGHQYLGGVGLFDNFVIWGAVQIAFLIKHSEKPTPYIPLLHAKLSNIQVEAGIGERILENNYPKNKQY